MKIMAFNGSPRKGGNTDTLLEAVSLGVSGADASLDIVRLSELKMSPCIACGGCDKTGKCVVMDDMQALYGRISAADKIIIASPIYFYTLSAQTKIFIDRLQAMWSRKQLLKAAGRWQPDDNHQGYLLSVAATSGPRIFEGAALCARYAFDALGFTYAGDFLVRGADSREDIKKDSEKLKQATDFGRKIAVKVNLILTKD
ncbi:MAG: flavodoxin family protein [Deltaproteobacteria bacterium]|nr:flavodoxin family protein [Deltaproteobacteria bacterium]